ncbi:LCP family protein, partial [Brachyspira hampsonii]
NNDIYGAYVGIISSLNNRIGLIGLPKNIALWENDNSSAEVIEQLYKNGGENAVFRAIENSVNKKITYRIAIDNNQISDIIDLMGGVKMYVEEPINYKDEEKGYELSFDIGEWLFTGKKVISYLHYLNMKGYEDIETLYRLEDVIVNSMISLIQSPQLRNIIHSKDMRKAIFGSMKSNLRPPDMKAIMNILANSNERTLVIENIDARVSDNGILTPIFDGSAFIKQMDDLTLYVELKTQKSELNNEDVSLTVLNATTVVGLADRINIRMRYRGFSAGEYGNFGTNLNESVVLIRDGQIEKAFMVANEGRVTRVYAKTDRRVLNNAVLILGNDYYEITQ